MLFKKKDESLPDIPRCCGYCESATIISDEGNVLCAKKGIVSCEYKCRKFVYDPLKRKPRALPPLPELNAEDFIL